MDRKTISHRDALSPLVSVIIPAYNAEQFIEQAIQSVLAQTFQAYEIIVVDDGSTDKTQDILRGFKGQIHCIFQENCGPSSARNAGIKIAQGEYIGFLDADDLWTPTKLEVQLDYMKRYPDIALVCSDHQDFDVEGDLPGSWLGSKRIFEDSDISEGPIQNAFLQLIQDNFISTPTVILKKACFEEIGGFDEEIWSVEDRDLWLRISASFSIACIPKIFCKRRRHQSNISKRQGELTLKGRIRVLEKNWRLFPGLVPDLIWRRELAEYYFNLGCLRLQKGERWRAFQAVSKNLLYAVAMVLSDRSLVVRPTLKSLGLLCGVIVGWQVSRFFGRAWKNAVHITP